MKKFIAIVIAIIAFYLTIVWVADNPAPIKGVDKEVRQTTTTIIDKSNRAINEFKR